MSRSVIGMVGALVLLACGANEAPVQGEGAPPERGEAAAQPAAEPAPQAVEAPAEDPDPPPPPEPEPEPVVIEAGVRLGPIRIDMSEEEVRALGLEEREIDPRSRGFGPYRVFFDDSGVQRIEAQLGELERIRFGERVFDAQTHIHQLRDAFPSCEWYEGGGERYRCANRTLFVRTMHSMDPAHYLLAVER